MQAVLLAAGESSRFFPFNNKHKCLTKIAGESIAAHTIRAIKRSGITDLIFVVPNENDFQEELGNGKKFGVKIKYVIQKKAQGMGDALLSASFLIKSDFFLVNSSHVEFEELKKSIDKLRTNRQAILVAKESAEKHYGLLKLEGDRVIKIVEKPKSMKDLSNFRIVGVYFLNQEFLSVLKNTKSEHYSLENALNTYAMSGKVRVARVSSEIVTLKYPWDVLKLKDFILNKMTRSISKKATIAKDALIQGNVAIEEGVVISERAVIKGPAYIGKDVFIGSNTLIRSGCDIEKGAKIGAYMEIKNSLLGSNSTTHSGFVGDSVIGQGTKIGALFGSANVRLDRENIKAMVKNKKTDTQRHTLGVIVGENVRIGERVSTMPGVIIGNNSTIGPSTTVMKNVPSDVFYYTKFAGIVKKQKSGL